MTKAARTEHKYLNDLLVTGAVVCLLGLAFIIVYLGGLKTVVKTVTSTPVKATARAEKDPTTYFDAVLVNFDRQKKLLELEVTKNGYTSRIEQQLNSNITISEVVYNSKTSEIISTTDLKSSQLKTGQSLRLFVKNASTDFDLSNLTKIQVLEGR